MAIMTNNTTPRASALSFAFLVLPAMMMISAMTTAAFAPSSTPSLLHQHRQRPTTARRRRRGRTCRNAPGRTIAVAPMPNARTAAQPPLLALPLSGLLEDATYAAQSTASSLVAPLLDPSAAAASTTSVVASSSLLLMYAAGLLTSASPCSLGLLPLTVSYIASETGQRESKTTLLPTLAYAAGLASVFCALGLSFGMIGGAVMGDGGAGGDSDEGYTRELLACLSGTVSIIMGLRLLDLVNVPLPSFDATSVFEKAGNLGKRVGGNRDAVNGVAAAGEEGELLFDDDGNLEYFEVAKDDGKSTSSNDGASLLRTFFLGGSSALVASPCATPVLTSILAYVASSLGEGGGSSSPLLGATYLLLYTLGYATPLLIIGATGGQALVDMQQRGAGAVDVEGGPEGSSGLVGRFSAGLGRWINPLMASVLVYTGTNMALTALWGDPSLAGLAPVL